MANTKKKRKRKRRGTQGGSVSTRPQGRPRNRQEARQRAEQRRAAGKGGKSGKGSGAGKATTASGRPAPKPPNWRGAIGKGVLASVLFFGLFAGLFHRPVGASAALAAVTLAFYVPLSYYLDGFMYRRYQANLARERQKAKEAKDPKGGGDA